MLPHANFFLKKKTLTSNVFLTRPSEFSFNILLRSILPRGQSQMRLSSFTSSQICVRPSISMSENMGACKCDDRFPFIDLLLYGIVTLITWVPYPRGDSTQSRTLQTAPGCSTHRQFSSFPLPIYHFIVNWLAGYSGISRQLTRAEQDLINKSRKSVGPFIHRFHCGMLTTIYISWSGIPQLKSLPRLSAFISKRIPKLLPSVPLTPRTTI